MEDITKWDKRFLDLATTVATYSKDPSTKCGAVITRNKDIVSLGYNGFPRKIEDHPERYLDREEKYKRIIHAEINAILNAKRDLDGCTLYISHPPCNHCALIVIQAEITRVVYRNPGEDFKSRWMESCITSQELFYEAGVEVKSYD